ncbi:MULTISPECIES: ABC transporter permease [unclassified Devosia]|uniref:ABC transporter permease n=1 Tax=unclassified Devosia TaxID=196773 RepID=UPI00086D4A53|nr:MULTISPECIES: ABC transporter permease [unclassified Devosia]MBN9361358.1 ABC transporter permease [Devosia sp.]ODS85902.1 MAG: peptide ABC transporter permease [Devosia sp. SCN 66-27]OJX26436.1 MAG: peptide ABC transporter permease [Devosia sp. 66-14]
MSSVAAPAARDSLLKAALRSPNFLIGGVITLVFVLAALLSFVWTPYDYLLQNIPNKLKPPSAEHWLGTDHFGRDILSMIMVGARTSIAVAFIAVTVAMVIGVPIGLWAAAKRGTLLDDVLMRANDLVFAFPALLIAILITAVFGPGAINAIIAVGLYNMPVFARLARAGALSLWQREFIMAARVSGKGAARISFEHILPNILNTLVVQATIQFALGILAEAALAYVGLGVQPPTPSWGKMLADSQTMISLAPHVALVPGLTIVLMVLGVNLLGDGLRDIFDPRLRRNR